jgi:hypothetical protein
MTVPGGGIPDPRRGGGEQDAVYASDLHLARCSPVCDALGGLDWCRPVIWFADFGLLPLDRGLQLRLGVTPPNGAPARIKALTATLVAPATGVIATQEFPLAPYVNRDRDAERAISLCEQGGRFSFVLGPALAPLGDAQRRRLGALCRAIEAWAALLSGGALPCASLPAAVHPDALAGASQADQLLGEDQDQLVVTDEDDEVQEPTRVR